MILQARDRGLFTRDHRLRRRRVQLGGRRDGRGDRRRGRARQGAAQVRGAVATPRSGSREAQERMVLAVPPDEVAGAASAVRERGRRGDGPRHVRGDRPADAAVPGRTGRRPRRCTSCTTAGPTVVRKATCDAAEPERPPPRPTTARPQRRRCSQILGTLQRLQQGMDHPPVRPRGAGRQRRQAAGRRRTTTARATRRSCMPVLGSWRGPGDRLRDQPALRRPRPVRDGRAARSTRRCATASPSAPTRTGSRSSTTSAGATPSGPEALGSLVRAAEACRDVALAFGTPFISGKDSLNNEYRSASRRASSSRRTLLISAMGRVPDVRRCVTMDLKEPGNDLYLVGDDAATSWAARTATWSPGRAGGARADGRPGTGAEAVRGGPRGDRAGAGAGVPRPERRRPGGRRWPRWPSPAASGRTSRT